MSSTPVVPLPRWLLALGILTLIAAHSQLTLRHWALRLAGLRVGTIQRMVPGEAGRSRASDDFAIFRPQELAGRKLFLGDAIFPVAANGQTWIEVAAPAEAVQAALAAAPRGEYRTGVNELGPLARLAWRMPAVPVTPSDLLLGACLAGLALVAWQRRRFGGWPDACLLVFLGIAACSLLPACRWLDAWTPRLPPAERRVSPAGALKEWLQYVEVFAVAWLVFREMLRCKAQRRVLIWTLAGCAAATLAAGFWEYALALSGRAPRGLAAVGEVDGWFGLAWNPSRPKFHGSESSHNVLGLYLAMLAPLWLALAWRDDAPWWRRGLCLVLALASLVLILNAALLAAAVAGCLAVAALHRWRWLVPATVAGILLVLGTWCAKVPEHARILVDSVALFRHADPYGLLPMPAKGQGEQSFAAWSPWQQKYVERQAALNALSWSPLLGHGLGSYQARIDAFYGASRQDQLWLEKGAANLMETDAHGLYFVLLVETGLLGLLGLLWILADAWRQAARVRAETSDGFDRALLAGVMGALLVLALGGFTGSFVVRGLQLVAALLLAVPAALAARRAPAGAGGREKPAARSA